VECEINITNWEDARDNKINIKIQNRHSKITTNSLNWTRKD
jgi:hypothetical protein